MAEQWLVPLGYYAGPSLDGQEPQFAVRIGRRLEYLDLVQVRVWFACSGSRQNGVWRAQRPDVERWLADLGMPNVGPVLDGLIGRGLVRQLDDDAQAKEAAGTVRVRPLLAFKSLDPTNPTRVDLGFFSRREPVAHIFPGEYNLWKDGPSFGSLAGYLEAVAGPDAPPEECWALWRAAGALFGLDAGYLDLADES